MDAVEMALEDDNGPLPLYLGQHTGHKPPSAGDICRSSSCQYMCLDVFLGTSKPTLMFLLYGASFSLLFSPRSSSRFERWQAALARFAWSAVL